ncbi:hypothetical protein B4N89_46095 [Embleya scabrispora]|uniref:Single-stranded DNA-binding protein n=1 Tax=Embleya scabrispora TaxID=159449 RepID=A0A1T3NJ33_9ACTN|nr:single-stranded DNA-binding protein [Embleya scabrispora]OPC76847.1 hypothetical protein B4N89_46095 [Embleya scabrispora]
MVVGDTGRRARQRVLVHQLLLEVVVVLSRSELAGRPQRSHYRQRHGRLGSLILITGHRYQKNVGIPEETSSSLASTLNRCGPRSFGHLGQCSPREHAGVPTSGVAVVTFTVASNTRNFDRDSGSWKDGATLFLRCSAWRRLAENIGESGLRRGMGVMVRGRLESHTYDSKDGERRTSVELTAEDVGASLGRSAATGLRIQGSGVQGDPATTLSNEDR